MCEGFFVSQVKGYVASRQKTEALQNVALVRDGVSVDSGASEFSGKAVRTHTNLPDSACKGRAVAQCVTGGGKV